MSWRGSSTPSCRGSRRHFSRNRRYGACVDDQIFVNQATVPDVPLLGEALFYLVRGVNDADRGIVGRESDGTLRTIGLPCDVFASCGELKLGFECAPLFESQVPDPLGNTIFFVPDTAGLPIGSVVFIEGEVVPGCEPLCPFPCILDNTTELDPTCDTRGH